MHYKIKEKAIESQSRGICSQGEGTTNNTGVGYKQESGSQTHAW